MLAAGLERPIFGRKSRIEMESGRLVAMRSTKYGSCDLRQIPRFSRDFLRKSHPPDGSDRTEIDAGHAYCS